MFNVHTDPFYGVRGGGLGTVHNGEDEMERRREKWRGEEEVEQEYV